MLSFITSLPLVSPPLRFPPLRFPYLYLLYNILLHSRGLCFPFHFVSFIHFVSIPITPLYAKKLMLVPVLVN